MSVLVSWDFLRTHFETAAEGSLTCIFLGEGALGLFCSLFRSRKRWVWRVLSCRERLENVKGKNPHLILPSPVSNGPSRIQKSRQLNSTFSNSLKNPLPRMKVGSPTSTTCRSWDNFCPSPTSISTRTCPATSIGDFPRPNTWLVRLALL